MVGNFRIDIWKVYCYWAFWVGVVFFSVYPTCNWITSNRTETYSLYLNMELSIPLVPEFIWLYISMYALFLLPPFFLNTVQLNALGKQLILATVFSGILFLLIPTELGFARITPANQFYASAFSKVFAVDLPHNLVPSLHVIFSSIIVFSLLKGLHTLIAKSIIWMWLTLLCLSTLLVHQHHMLDILSGLVIAILFTYYFKEEQHA